METFRTSMWRPGLFLNSWRTARMLLFGAFLLCVGPATAGDEAKTGPTREQEAQRLINGGEFEKAVWVLENQLNTAELAPEQLVDMYRMLGLAHLYLGNEKAAQKALEKLFQARPDFELPDETPPKVRGLYQRIQSEWKRHHPRLAALAFDKPERVLQGKPLNFVIATENVPAKASMKLYFRRKGTQVFHSVDFDREAQGRTCVASVPAYFLPAEPTSYTMEYYLEVIDPTALRLAGEGSAFAPLQFQVVPPTENSSENKVKNGSWQQNPWVWVGVGAAAVGLIVGGVMLVNSPTSTK